MNRLHTYLLLLALPCFTGSCYKDASDRFLDEKTEVVSNGEEEENERVVSQNHWIYDQMKKNYLWEAHLPDTSRLSFSEYPRQFFSRLLYEGDRFSWIEPNSEYSGSSLYDSYGLDYLAYTAPEGETLYRALLVRRDSPAQRAGIKRGDWFQVVRESGSRVELKTGSLDGNRLLPGKTVVMQAGEQPGNAAASIELDTVYRMGGKTIGYLLYNEFMDSESIIGNPYRAELRDAFRYFRQEGISDLIIDLRYNPGGYVSICRYLGSLITPDECLGAIWGYHSFNKNLAAQQYEETGSEEETVHFYGANIMGGNNLGMRKVYFIITRRTASASESLINSLSAFIEVTKIGTASTGKGVGSWTIQSNLYEWQLQPITFRYYNKNHESVPDSGLVPDVPVDESDAATLYELGDVRERLLSAALDEILGGTLRAVRDERKITLVPGGKQPSPGKIKGYRDKHIKSNT
ncbi:MAG: hypothetical protein LBQ73_07765 [Tannerellaceae bacterium]|jgi:C-terminal processing protease CtpA/Prc|nr:hypothetical protein [Tannerellaceae bacterium]